MKPKTTQAANKKTKVSHPRNKSGQALVEAADGPASRDLGHTLYTAYKAIDLLSPAEFRYRGGGVPCRQGGGRWKLLTPVKKHVVRRPIAPVECVWIEIDGGDFLTVYRHAGSDSRQVTSSWPNKATRHQPYCLDVTLPSPDASLEECAGLIVEEWETWEEGL